MFDTDVLIVGAGPSGLTLAASLVKRGIDGVNHAVSAKYLQTYVNAYAFRWNHRDDRQAMFQTMLCRVSVGNSEVHVGHYVLN